MLRYFYILVCIQLCFCSYYTDNVNNGYLERKIRSKDNKLHKKLTRNPKRSRVVQFNVDNFIRRPDVEAVDDYEPHAYKNKRRDNRKSSKNYGGYRSDIESNARRENSNDYNNVNDNVPEVNTRSAPAEEMKSKRFNFPSMSLDDKNVERSSHFHDKALSSFQKKLSVDREIIADSEKKCAFRNMRIPFFSYDKSPQITTTKAKRKKKRRMFCLNCHKTSTSTPNSLENNPDIKNNDLTHNVYDTMEYGEKKVYKRTYGELCPKCIRELLNSLRKKTSKTSRKVKHETTPPVLKETKALVNLKTTTILDKAATLDNTLHNSFNDLGNVRNKRNEEEERERRLKELEEVERKIENVHITAPTFTRVAINVEH